jgi:glycosyltransferase involved in cell wall biosynthesis
MKFSIIVPTYNEEHYIPRCLQSIKDQRFDHTEFEVIVSDADSTDRTREVARTLCDKIETTDKRGIALGRNLGTTNATGKYLVFVDADVVLEQVFLQKLDASFRDESVVAVTGIAKPSDGALFPRLVYTGTYLLVRFFNILGLSLFPGICVAYRSDAFRDSGGFREDFGIVEDLDLSRRMSRRGACVISSGAVAYVSTRRLEHHALSTVLFHIYNDVKYLLSGTPAKAYLKREELHSWKDIWRQ